jgi:hypothetical protein
MLSVIILSVIMLNVIILSVIIIRVITMNSIMLSVVKLNTIMLSVIILNVAILIVVASCQMTLLEVILKHTDTNCEYELSSLNEIVEKMSLLYISTTLIKKVSKGDT